MPATIVNKISTDTVMGSERQRPPEGVAIEWIFRVVGVATGFEQGETNYGPFVALTGEFHAVRFSDAEEFTSGKCFLPCGVAEMIANTMGIALAEGKPAPAVKFVYDIGLKPAKNRGKPEDAVKYEYAIRNPTDSGEGSASKVLSLAPVPQRVLQRQLPTGKNIDVSG